MTDRSAKKPSSKGQSVLVIDDDAGNLALLSEFLRSGVLSILVAEDGESGIERARYARPDLILLDVLMPGLDGYATCMRLKADEATAAIPVIFMTALSETEFKIKGFAAGGVDYVTKPFQREEVLARVGVHLRIAELTKNLREVNDMLEKRVEERTSALAAANMELAADIAERKLVEERLRLLIEEKSELLREIHHRVKNNLQIITSILNLEAANVADPSAKEMFKRCQGRIASMAIVHEELYLSSDLASIDFRIYVDQLIAGRDLCASDRRLIAFSNEVAEVRLTIENAIPCGLAINELLTNAFRHAFPDGWAGERRVTISMEHREGRYIIRIADTGVGLPEGFDPAKAETLGMQLAYTAIGQLHGILKMEPGIGARFRIEFPDGIVADPPL